MIEGHLNDYLKFTILFKVNLVCWGFKLKCYYTYYKHGISIIYRKFLPSIWTSKNKQLGESIVKVKKKSKKSFKNKRGLNFAKQAKCLGKSYCHCKLFKNYLNAWTQGFIYYTNPWWTQSIRSVYFPLHDC